MSQDQVYRYRVLGWIDCVDGSYITKGKTIFQCNSFDVALAQLKKIHDENMECTRFSIERGEWQ